MHWAILEPYIPKPLKKGVRPWNDHQTTVNDVLWKLKTGMQQRDIPERYSAWQSIYDQPLAKDRLLGLPDAKTARRTPQTRSSRHREVQH
jgi:transposase